MTGHMKPGGAPRSIIPPASQTILLQFLQMPLLIAHHDDFFRRFRRRNEFWFRSYEAHGIRAESLSIAASQCQRRIDKYFDSAFLSLHVLATIRAGAVQAR